MKNLRTTAIVAIVLATSAFGGCATVMPPTDLVNARSAYDRASKGPAAQLDPADLHIAKAQLDAAETTFAKDGDTQETRDQAYVAVRKVELAEIRARTITSDQTAEGVVGKMHADQTRTVAATSAELGRTQAQLALTGVALEGERVRREAAEKRSTQLAADLARFATVKQEARGMVITLSGSVLFASAKWDLLPAAQLRLNDVATALTKEDPLSKMVVEGHTDSQGAAAYNQDLSQHRAQAVRDYLVSRGVAGDRIVAQGFGPTRSVSDNGTPEGRANNRRVEIIVSPVTP